MSFSVVFAPEAVTDTLDAYNYYKAIDPDLAERLENKLIQQINSIQKHPKSSPVAYKHFRRSLLNTFPYALFYTIEENHIRIFGLIHQRRHFPDILKERE